MIDRQRTAPGAVPRSYRAAFGCISDAAKATAEVEHFIPVNVGLCRRALMRAHHWMGAFSFSPVP